MAPCIEARYPLVSVGRDDGLARSSAHLTRGEHVTVNLTAPVVFDSDIRKGAQVILHDPRFKTRHILLRVPKQITEEAR